MNKLIYLDKNVSRGYSKVKLSLRLLKENGLINYEDDKLDNDIIRVKWINLFPNKKDSGWIAFTCNDFDIFDIVGVDFYCVMWLLRMYTNHNTNTSFVAIKDISKLIGCKATQTQRAVDLYEYSGLFEVVRGQYYKPEGFESEKAIKRNNSYKYTGDLEWLLKLNNIK